jgi:hypothetical protein
MRGNPFPVGHGFLIAMTVLAILGLSLILWGPS